jgi:hypothetical protein
MTGSDSETDKSDHGFGADMERIRGGNKTNRIGMFKSS